MRNALLSLTPLLFAASAVAAEPTPVSSLETLRQICRRVSTAELSNPQMPGPALPAAATAPSEVAPSGAPGAAEPTEYRVALQPSQFKIAEVDPESAVITVDTGAAFRLFKGQATLYPVDADDLDLRVPEGKPWPATPQGLTLVLTFRPGQITDAPCSVAEGPGSAVSATQVVLGIEILSARLQDPAGAVVAELEEDPSLARQGPTTGAPQLEIDPAVTETSPQLSRRITAATTAAHDRLLGCYQKSLAHDPGLDGSQVITFSASPRGEVSGVTVVADSVQSDEVQKCVTGIFNGLKLEAATRGQPTQEEMASIALRFSRR